jgi:hypothetical protein
MTRVSGYAAPAIGNRSYRIEADVEIVASTEGVILAAGGRPGGYVLFMQHGRLVHEYIGPARRWVVESAHPLPAGRHLLAFEFCKTGNCAGVGTLSCDGVSLGRIDMDGLWPLGPASGGVFCGYDDGIPASERYALPFMFTGKIHHVIVEAGDAPVPDTGLEDHAALSED